jgi:hypothetical protein
MTRDQLELANRRLSGAESFTVAPSHYLGHYVAGHLAERIGARVRLDRTRSGGISASIDLPFTVLVPDPGEAPPVPNLKVVEPA